uniref:Uncharacterized protein TCIL3000_11_16290 n=1 Tax=Trypanosoma congolense (strain IL3000) TaxID=1068625 RepID=G0V396_TRYCI|nr:unnamed protein product [Trypanosoma congolense IL3000]
MLTPLFVCTQDDSFVIVAITLSAICKAMGAVFDIARQQFTFHCTPYYLRLKFDQPITEGCGEHATYDIASSVLTVYVPKENRGEFFTNLDNPAYLIATDVERRRLVQLVGTVPCAASLDDEEARHGGRDGNAGVNTNDEEGEEEEDTEFRQKLLLPDHRTATLEEGLGDYGFAASFHGTFAALDADLVADILDLPCNPDETNTAHRRQLRIQREQEDFDEDALLISFEDAEGEVERLLRYVPQHQRVYLKALDEEGVRYVRPVAGAEDALSLSDTTGATGPIGGGCVDVLEEEDVVLPLSSGVVKLWAGNIGEFKRPLVEEVPPAELGTNGSSDPSVEAGGDTAANDDKTCGVTPMFLAVPQERPRVDFTSEEHAVLLRITAPQLLFPPRAEAVNALTADTLFAEAYDDLVTEGCGCSESLWNVCKLSPALSWLDSPDTVYDACVAFARRVLVYPLHRSFALVQRVFSMVGIRLLLGKSYVIKALLRVHDILAHAEHRHVLVTLFMRPLVGYWMNVENPDNRLAQLALEVHAHIARTAAEWEPAPPAAVTQLQLQKRRQLLPLNLLNLGLPIS